MFVELKRREYYNGSYYSENTLFAVDDIVRVLSCVDDRNCTNVVTRDGKVHTITERYEAVVKKLNGGGARNGD